MKKRTLADYFVVSLKGIAMGAADVVPGVSGGTIAFISGIYQELLSSISSFDLSLIKELKQSGFKSVWEKINGNFLASLFIGIAISVASLAKIISWMLDNHPVQLWSFFFGLVLASVVYIGKQIGKIDFKKVLFFVVGAGLALWITMLKPLVTDNTSMLFLFIAGALAICAMILPGISGAFILVLLGAYKPILEAVHSRDLKIIAVVGAGAVIGLLIFSKILKWLFSKYEQLTLAVLCGFIFGSLNKIWPWKKVLETKTIEEKTIVLREQSVLPSQFEGEPQLLTAILLMCVGFCLILLLEKIASKSNGR